MHILIVDDDEKIGASLAWLLEEDDHRVTVCTNGLQALSCLEEHLFHVAFLDVMMPEMGGLEVLEKVLEQQPDVTAFMISGHADVSIAVQATKLGAYDFLEKPLNPEKVRLEMKKLIEQNRVRQENDQLRLRMGWDTDLVGSSDAMAEVRAQIERAAPSDGRILIMGENGTGKELVARAIHQKSTRHNNPFVQLNCAAIPRELIESELFGYEKGAFTGAHKRKPGLIDQAEKGTLLLDEVGDMAPETQAKLLRVLQENEYYRLGGTKPQRFDVRIISATNKDLEHAIQKGAFRQDLYYRLNVIPITVPPLRSRVEDIPDLTFHFLRLVGQKYGKKEKHLTPTALQRLSVYHWPGNVRELANAIERLVIMTPGDMIDLSDVQAVLEGHPSTTHSATSLSLTEDRSLKDRVQDYEKKVLQDAYDRYGGNVSRMAQKLQTDRANLHRKLQRYGIKT
jgi:two-component system nitrogen regulation response regulator NtrX